MIGRITWTPELVSRFWQGVSQTRLRDLSFGKLAGPYLFLLVRQYLAAQARLLDFGAGDGDFVRLLVDRGFATAAFEPSAARRAAIWSRVDNRFPFLGCIGPDYQGTPFDVIFMFEVIEHILDASLAPTFAMIDRLLAPDGLLIITTPNNEDLDLASSIDPRGEVLFHRWQHVRSLTRQSLTGLMEGHGFHPIVLHEIEISDRVFAAYDGGLASRPEFANLFNTYRPLTIGNGERLVAVAARRPAAAAARAELGELDAWSAAPVVVRASTTLDIPHAPMAGRGDESPPRPTDGHGDASPLVVRLDPAAMRRDAGHGWSAELPEIALPHSTANGSSAALELYEDHLPLGPRQAKPDAIRERGRGRFRLDGSTVLFSASDNSDPAGNNRLYRAVLP